MISGDVARSGTEIHHLARTIEKFSDTKNGGKAQERESASVPWEALMFHRAQLKLIITAGLLVRPDENALESPDDRPR